MLGLEPAGGIANPAGSNNRFSIFEIHWRWKYTRKGFWKNTNQQGTSDAEEGRKY